MPPALIRPLQLAARGNAELLSALAEQWTRPADILSVLLLVGPDIVQKAVAQLSGRVITPVAFSFGWVAYSTSALMATFGDGKLMPNADVEGVLVMDTDSGHSRVTKNWVLGRLLRDMDDRLDGERTHEAAHVPPTIAAEIHAPPPPATATTPKHATLAKSPQQPWDALQITVYAVDKKPPVPHGIPVLDRVWYLGCTVIVVQLVIAMIPWILNGEWDTFLITGAGTLFALVGGSQSQWQSEKWACPKTGGASVVLTQGNGSRHAVVILNNRKDKTGLDLEILARGTRTSRASPITTAVSSVLAFAWIVLLITVAGFAGNSWYLLGIGFLGTVQNLFAAGAPRQPAALGVHLRPVDIIRGRRVAAVLRDAEAKYPGVGTSMLGVFFPGGLRVKDGDLDFWRKAVGAKLAPNKYGTRVDLLSHSNLEDGSPVEA